MRAVEPAALAALSLCESIILALIEKGVLRPDEILQILEDAEYLHERAGTDDYSQCSHIGAAAILRSIIGGTNLQAASRR